MGHGRPLQSIMHGVSILTGMNDMKGGEMSGVVYPEDAGLMLMMGLVLGVP